MGLAIQAGAVALVKYGFDSTDTFVLNVANIVGLGVAMVFRFWAYSRWVWKLVQPAEPSLEQPLDDRETHSQPA